MRARKETHLILALEQHVSGSEVSVDNASRFQVSHALGDLHRPCEQLLAAEIHLVLRQIVLEAAQRHELRDQLHTRSQANAEQLDAEVMLHRSHHVRLVQELFGCRQVAAFLQFLNSDIDGDLWSRKGERITKR